ncbi:hypothetical protein D9758_011067 [Tetrapyrgos nigripes]|uniref:Uncharacterized protein n=1 Tax=Tetrapyrgos nigripes TaxID=182062 RepID=A0A8H5CUA8_9AGAR|nr:hypothetical protein D9758_011067 [Tetrapyrgos nigripes]
MLSEAWPGEYDAEAEVSVDTASATADRVPSLFELSIPSAVEHSLSINDTKRLEELAWMPGRADHLKKVLMGKKPFPDSGISLLEKILEHDFNKSDNFTLDLSAFTSLSSEQIALLVKEVSGAIPNIKSVDLSGNQNISAATVAEVLRAIPQLLRLVLLNTSIENEELLNLLFSSPTLFYQLHDLVHLAFLRPTSVDYGEKVPSPEKLHAAYLHGLTVIFGGTFGKDISTVPFFNTEKLLKILTHHFQASHCQDPMFAFSYTQSNLGSAAVLSSGTTIVAADKGANNDSHDAKASEPIVLVDGLRLTTLLNATLPRFFSVLSNLIFSRFGITSDPASRYDDWSSRTISSIPRMYTT